MKITLPEGSGPSGILRAAQQAAGAHLTALGLEGEERRQNLAWVIIRTRCELFGAPVREITAMTWPGATRAGMMPRYCEMFREDGSLFARLSTTWVLTDAITRQMRLDAPISVPDLSRGDEPPMARALPRKELPFLSEFTPTPSQIDSNGHVNNAAYLDAAMDAAGHLLQGRQLSAFAVDYRAEILPGTEVSVFGAMEDNILYVCGKSESKEHFRMTLTCRQNTPKKEAVL